MKSFITVNAAQRNADTSQHSAQCEMTEPEAAKITKIRLGSESFLASGFSCRGGVRRPRVSQGVLPANEAFCAFLRQYTLL